jgi:hypothetical protein
MTDFRRDFRSAPVPIRLSCPFSNGITLNYYARALTCTSRVLRVLSMNPFERGIQLFVTAPFFSSFARCQVASVTRSKRQASSYEIDLRFVDVPAFLQGAATKDLGSPEGLLNSELPSLPGDSIIMSADIAQAAAEMAVALESSVGIPFAKAFEQARLTNRHLKLLALMAATLALSQEKNLAGEDFLVRAIKHAPLPQAEPESVIAAQAV